MRAIIIDDKDARDLIEKLELRRLQADFHNAFDPERKVDIDTVHRAFHYVVVRWLQDQGANTIR